MDSASYEQLNTETVHVHRKKGSQEDGVGPELVHHSLRMKVKKNEP